MLRKVKKYLKFVVCCTLIMSLVAPSYAALSASDGSAFVTKAEFDSALADFNARLTTFEAGINSKIDSQVTSYLDRNGIWNGKQQDCVFDVGQCVQQKDFGCNQIAAAKTYYYVGSDGTYKSKSQPAQTFRYYFKKTYDAVDKVFINEISKSGLFYGEMAERLDCMFTNEADGYIASESGGIAAEKWSYIYKNLPENERNYDKLINTPDKPQGFYGIRVGFGADRGINGYFNWSANWIIKIFDQNDVQKYYNQSLTLVPNMSRGETDRNWSGSMSINPFPVIHNLLFFVQKGDKLTFSAGWQGTGRDFSENDSGMFLIFDACSSPESYPNGRNQIIWYFATRNCSVY